MDLNAPSATWGLDSSNFLAGIESKSAMFEGGFKAGLDGASPDLSPAGLLFAGMGGSGVGAALVKDACTRAMDQPFTVVRHYQFPHHVGRDWHVVAVSYSGETEETMAVAKEAIARGVPITKFTLGGSLGKLAGSQVEQLAGYQPRQTIAYSWFSILGWLEGSGILNEKVPLSEAIQAVKEVDSSCGPGVPIAENEAKQLALQIHAKVPQIYATPAFYGCGRYFRAMLNENAKKIAGLDMIPECNHNDLMGWGEDPNRDHFTCIALGHAHQNPEIQARMEFMREQYSEWGVPWHQHVFKGIDTFQEHVVEQARAVQMLDYAAFYTAMLRGVDPSAIPAILSLKEQLRS